MVKKTFAFPSATVDYYFDGNFERLDIVVNRAQTIFLIDDHFFRKNKKKTIGWKCIMIPSGEQNKIQATVDNIIQQLIDLGADRSTTLVGIGGGVVTDITGYVAAVFMRGLSFGFIPTTILAMADAAIGGKNGIDVGMRKNMVGTIRQPKFIFYDFSLLKTLPKEEWINGFAEIIKHACIYDAAMFKMLEAQKISFYQKDLKQLARLVQRNVLIKTNAVIADEFEKGERKLLNFGHTVGHAVENLYQIPHGHAVSIGIGVACKIAERLNGFTQTEKVTSLLKQYGLPPQFDFDKEAVWKLIVSDKKKNNDFIDYIVLDKIGKASIAHLPLDQLHQLIQDF